MLFQIEKVREAHWEVFLIKFLRIRYCSANNPPALWNSQMFLQLLKIEESQKDGFLHHHHSGEQRNQVEKLFQALKTQEQNSPE